MSYVWLSYFVIAIAAVLEGSSLVRSLQQARHEGADRQQWVGEYVQNPDDPTVKSVVLEDSAALIGLALAAGGVGLHVLTGSAVWDGVAWVAARCPAGRGGGHAGADVQVATGGQAG